MPSHYLNQCSLIVNLTIRNKLKWNLKQNTKLFIQENTSEKVVCDSWGHPAPSCATHSCVLARPTTAPDAKTWQIPTTSHYLNQWWLVYWRIHASLGLNEFSTHTLPEVAPLTIRQVLFVSKDKDDSIPHLAVINDPMKLLPGLINTISISTVHHKYQALGACVIMSPQGTDFVLATYIL